MTPEQIIVDELTKFNTEIRNEMSRKGLDTTGKASASLRVVKSANIIASVGIDYIEYLNRGRGPGKQPPLEKIKQWVEAKNLEVAPFVIARKIGREGTEIFRDRTKGLMLEPKIEDTVKRITKRVGEAIAINVTKRITG
jgi:hypothetical protein